MPHIIAPHGRIEYEVEGNGLPMVMISGLGSQLIRWSPAFRAALVAQGFQVIRLDNRDTGLSHEHAETGVPSLKQVAAAVRAGTLPEIPYTLADMAGDVLILLDALSIDRAHIVGVSMGGFIAQLLAVEAPTRVASLTLIMTSTNAPGLPGPSAVAQAVLGRRSAGSEDRAALIDQGIVNQQAVGSPGYPVDPAALRARLEAEYDRSYRPAGYVRQRAAILADGDRSARVARINAPTMVLHGTDDALVDVAGGKDLAAKIPGAELRLFPGMGHEIPDALIPDITAAIAETARVGDACS